MKLNEYIEITNEDNMELMARYPDKYFDLSIVDPPFGINITNSGRLKKYNTSNTTWDDSTPNKDYFDELFRVSKNQIIWGGNYFIEHLKNTKCCLIYDKKQPEEISFASCEIAWTSFDSVTKTFYYSPMNIKNRIHSCEKPIALYAWILKNYAKQGDKIIDTHFGSGSIACAVHNANIIDKMDLSLVACELDKDYFESSIQRVKAALQTQSLF
jgi:site-specific DNA-methyltransferase (adenine-specific)